MAMHCFRWEAAISPNQACMYRTVMAQPWRSIPCGFASQMVGIANTPIGVAVKPNAEQLQPHGDMPRKHPAAIHERKAGASEQYDVHNYLSGSYAPCGLMGMFPVSIQQPFMGVMQAAMSNMMCLMGKCPASIQQPLIMSSMQAASMSNMLCYNYLPGSYTPCSLVGMFPASIQQPFMGAIVSNMMCYSYISGSYAPCSLGSVGMVAY